MNVKWSSFSLLKTLKESLDFMFKPCPLLAFIIKMKDVE